ncbi:MAG: hypothetical protein ACKON9_05785, partial [Planctomycetaceae bacterium]
KYTHLKAARSPRGRGEDCVVRQLQAGGGLTRIREAAKEGRWRAVFEYEYRPPGRTEYEYEGVGQWAVWCLAKPRRREGKRNGQC